MKRLVIIALFLNAFLIAGRLMQEADAGLAPPVPPRNGDVNCDGGLDLSDAVSLLNFLFSDGPEPCALAADAALERRVRDLELALVRLQESSKRHHTLLGTLSIAGAELSRLRAETDITARLSEIHAVATAGSDVTVTPTEALEFLGTVDESLRAIPPVSGLSARALTRPAALARETDAALDALNAWVEAVNGTVEHTLDGYPLLFAAIALAQSRGESLGVTTYLDAMVARNLARLRDVATGAEFRAAKDQMDKLLGAWEERLATAGDDAQSALIDLDTLLGKHRQLLQTIASTAELIHDTAMAIVRKIG